MEWLLRLGETYNIVWWVRVLLIPPAFSLIRPPESSRSLLLAFPLSIVAIFSIQTIIVTITPTVTLFLAFTAFTVAKFPFVPPITIIISVAMNTFVILAAWIIRAELVSLALLVQALFRTAPPIAALVWASAWHRHYDKHDNDENVVNVGLHDGFLFGLGRFVVVVHFSFDLFCFYEHIHKRSAMSKSMAKSRNRNSLKERKRTLRLPATGLDGETVAP